MRSNITQVGDFTPEFAMHTFFPAKLKGPVKVFSEVAYAMFNMCGFINWMQRYQQGLPAPEAKSQQFEKVETTDTEASAKPLSRKSSTEKKKRALNYLDDEIKSFTKKQIS